MSTPHKAGGSPSSTRVAVRLLGEFLGFASLLFVTRFIMHGYLAVQLDEECHIGGIAVDLLAHGMRFPNLVYVQSDYDNGSLLSGMLAAASFTLLGRSFLALKLVTHALAAAGAVASLSLLRGCLTELGWTSRRVRWSATGALVIAIALAPRVVTIPAMCTVGIGSPLDGSVINTLLLACFSLRVHARSTLRTTAFWVLVGLALYLNKATLPMIPVLIAGEIALGWGRWPLRFVAAAAGLLLGILPEAVVLSNRRGGMGWTLMLDKLRRHGRDFPHAFFESVWTLAQFRIELVVIWALALAAGLVLLRRSLPRWRSWWRGVPSSAAPGSPEPPLTLAAVVGAAWLQTTALALMSQGGFDYYTIYTYPFLVVLLALLVAWSAAEVETRWGERAGTWTGAAAVVAILALYRPEAMAPELRTVAWLWNNRAGAACSWRLAEGFRREDEAGLLPPGVTREQHVIARCHSLSEEEQVIDCIGGMARDLHYSFNGKVNGEPPAGLTPVERRAYAYYYGMRREGHREACDDLTDLQLRGDCVAAVQLDCLVRGGWGTQYSRKYGGNMRCEVPAPPMDGYWAAVRRDFLSRPPAQAIVREGRYGQDDHLSACKPVFDACY